MDQDKKVPQRRDALVENMAQRDNLPEGWRRLYDQLVVDLHKTNPDLGV